MKKLRNKKTGVIKEIEKEFEGRGDGDFIMAVGESGADALAPIKSSYEELFGHGFDSRYLHHLD